MTLTLDLPPAPAVEDETELIWVCEFTVQPTKEKCPNEAAWVGHFVCGCLGAACDQHKQDYDRQLRENSFLGLIRLTCNKHGVKHNVPIEQAVTWSPL